MSAPMLLDPWTDWHCPNCPVTDRTRPHPPGSARMHACGGLHMLIAPMVPAGTGCRVVAVERQDYLNGEIQAAGDDGKPYMAVRTDYPDGRNDLMVNAPLAVMRA